MKKTIPGSATPPEIAEGIIVVKPAMRRLLQRAASSRASGSSRGRGIGRAISASRSTIRKAPNAPSCDRTAITELEARELPSPTPRP